MPEENNKETPRPIDDVFAALGADSQFDLPPQTPFDAIGEELAGGNYFSLHQGAGERPVTGGVYIKDADLRILFLKDLKAKGNVPALPLGDTTQIPPEQIDAFVRTVDVRQKALSAATDYLVGQLGPKAEAETAVTGLEDVNFHMRRFLGDQPGDAVYSDLGWRALDPYTHTDLMRSTMSVPQSVCRVYCALQEDRAEGHKDHFGPAYHEVIDSMAQATAHFPETLEKRLHGYSMAIFEKSWQLHHILKEGTAVMRRALEDVIRASERELERACRESIREEMQHRQEPVMHSEDEMVRRMKDECMKETSRIMGISLDMLGRRF